MLVALSCHVLWWMRLWTESACAGAWGPYAVLYQELLSSIRQPWQAGQLQGDGQCRARRCMQRLTASSAELQANPCQLA